MLILVNSGGQVKKDKGPFPVPLETLHFIARGTYYAYGTHSDKGIEVYVSDDNLKNVVGPAPAARRTGSE